MKPKTKYEKLIYKAYTDPTYEKVLPFYRLIQHIRKTYDLSNDDIFSIAKKLGVIE